MVSTTQAGKTRRMDKLFSPKTGKAVLIPLDDSLISGPTMGLEDIYDKVELISQAQPDIIMGFTGLFKNYTKIFSHIPGILNLTASTTRSQHTRKIYVGSVQQALQLGLDAVAVHVNITSHFEPEMLCTLGFVAQDCDFYGMPLLAIMYPRSEGDVGDENYSELKQTNKQRYVELVAHAARVGVELGADLIKTQYPGDSESFHKVVQACVPVPVLVAGGPLIAKEAMFKIAYEVIQAGGAGISFGRNVFGRQDPRPYILALKAIVHDKKTVKEAIDYFDAISA